MPNNIVMNITQNIPAGNSSFCYLSSIEVGKTYQISIAWNQTPSFSGNYSGWKIQSASDTMNPIPIDLIIKEAKKNDLGTDTQSKVITESFTAQHTASAILFIIYGLSQANTAILTIEEISLDSNLLLDVSIELTGGTSYFNSYFRADFHEGSKYCILATWDQVPSYTAGSTAWKIQGASTDTIDGDGTVIFRALRDSSTNTSTRSFAGAFIPTADILFFNFFTQNFGSTNRIHIIIYEEPISETYVPLLLSAGNNNVYIDYNFQTTASYEISVLWERCPVYSGSLNGWSLSAVVGHVSNAEGQLIIKNSKKANESGIGKSVQIFSGVFTPGQSFNTLRLTSNGQFNEQVVLLCIKPINYTSDLLLDATISVANETEYISSYFKVDFVNGKYYDIYVTWVDTPEFTVANEGKTAWKVQAAINSSVAGDDTVIYKTLAKNYTALKSFHGIFYCSSNIPIFNFFSQRINSANIIHFTITENTFLAQPLSYVNDSISATQLFQVSTQQSGHIIQGFDIYNNIVFQCYDGGYCVTYEFDTGTIISSFSFGSSYVTNHCGNANFGSQFPEGNSQFPALYISGDLTTKACYVESVTAYSASLVQTIYFDIDPSYTGGQVIVDKSRNRLIYMQRLNSNIYFMHNVFMITEFPIPLLSEGQEIHYTNEDVLGDPYVLSYFSPVYQGATVYRGNILQTHGYYANSLGSTVGVMSFNVSSHVFTRYINLSSQIPAEPQGITIYNNKLIMNFINGKFYEIYLNLGIPENGYIIEYSEVESEMILNIREEVAQYIQDPSEILTVEATFDTEPVSGEMVFEADVSFQTPYGIQAKHISGIVELS